MFPEVIHIFSNTTYDDCVSSHPYEYNKLKLKYSQNNYEIPRLIYWNLQSPITNIKSIFENKVTIVDGYSLDIADSIDNIYCNKTYCEYCLNHDDIQLLKER